MNEVVLSIQLMLHSDIDGTLEFRVVLMVK